MVHICHWLVVGVQNDVSERLAIHRNMKLTTSAQNSNEVGSVSTVELFALKDEVGCCFFLLLAQCTCFVSSDGDFGLVVSG